MKNNFLRNLIIGTILSAGCFVNVVNATLIESINALAPGSEYRVIFTTSTATAATSTDIATYNEFVQAAAAAGSITAPLGLSWQALASTASIDAYVNVGLHNTDTNIISIFNSVGLLVATSGADLWNTNGTLGASIVTTENGLHYTNDNGCITGFCSGAPIDPSYMVWTGTNNDGTAAAASLGTSNPTVGCVHCTTNQWVADSPPSFFRVGTSGKRLYGISSSGFTTAVPEPSTLAIFALGVMGLASRRFKKNK